MMEEHDERVESSTFDELLYESWVRMECLLLEFLFVVVELVVVL